MSSRGLPALSGESGLSRYLTEIRKFPLLSPEEEYMFAKRWREHEDPEAARRLVTSHLRLVAKIAMGYRGYGLPVVGDRLGRQCRPDAGGQALRARQGLPPGDLCHVVDPRLDPGICPQVLELGEDGHHGGAEEAVLQSAQGQDQYRRHRGRRSHARPQSQAGGPVGRHRDRSDGHEPPPVGRAMRR